MPTTMSSTSRVASSRRRSAKRALFIQLPNLEQRLDEFLQAAETLFRSKLEHLSDLGAIDAVLVHIDGDLCGARHAR
jgi:hypothetical protein